MGQSSPIPNILDPRPRRDDGTVSNGHFKPQAFPRFPQSLAEARPAPKARLPSVPPKAESRRIADARDEPSTFPSHFPKASQRPGKMGANCDDIHGGRMCWAQGVLSSPHSTAMQERGQRSERRVLTSWISGGGHPLHAHGHARSLQQSLPALR